MGVLTEAIGIARGRPPASVTTRARSVSPALTWSPGIGLTLSNSEGSFERSAVALRCILLIAQNLASLDAVTLVNGEPDDADPIARLWNQGTADAPYSARVVREVLFARQELAGEAFAYTPRDNAGNATGIYPIFGAVEIVVPDSEEEAMTGGPIGFRVSLGARRLNLLPDEVLWLRYPHPTQPWGALAPWRAAMGAVEADALASKWQRQEYRNSARPSAVIGLGDLTDEQHEQAVAVYRSRIEGPDNAGRSLLVSSARRPVVEHLGLSPAEMSFIESRVANADEAMLAHGINPDLLRAGSTYENRAAAKTALWSDTLLAKLDTAASELDRQMQPAPERVTGFDISKVDALRESVDAVYSRAVSAVQADVATLDEARAMVDLEPLPGGVGAMTITPYRQSMIAGEPLPRMTARALPTPRVVRVAGDTRTIRSAPARVEVRAVPGPKQIESAYTRHERIGVRAIRALAARQEKAVLQALKSLDRKGKPLTEWARPEMVTHRAAFGAPADALAGLQAVIPDGIRVAADDVFDSTFWAEETAKALEGFLTGAFTEGGNMTATRIGLSFEQFDQRVLTAMASRLDVLSTQVTATTRAILEAQILASGVEAGEAIPDLAARIRATFTDLERWRATMIARTETVGGFNEASHEVASASGLVVFREWLATADDRTRPSHVAADGERVRGTARPYSNGLRFPGDPTGPPAETINCRCVELFDTE